MELALSLALETPIEDSAAHPPHSALPELGEAASRSIAIRVVSYVSP
jgi:hypothetical protein